MQVYFMFHRNNQNSNLFNNVNQGTMDALKPASKLRYICSLQINYRVSYLMFYHYKCTKGPIMFGQLNC